MAKKRDYSVNPPQNLSDLNKESMLDYIENYHPEDIDWFIELLDNNPKERVSYMNAKNGGMKKGETISGYDWAVIREAFMKRYFNDVLEAKKAKKNKKPDSFTDRINKLRKK